MYNSLVEDAAPAFQLPLEKVPLFCVEKKISLLKRYKLKKSGKSAEARKCGQHLFTQVSPKSIQSKEIRIWFVIEIHTGQKIRILFQTMKCN